MRRTMRSVLLGGTFTGSGGASTIVSHGAGIILGDSTTARTPPVYSFLLNPTQDLITNLAIPGDTTIGQIAKFDALSQAVKDAAKWVIIMTGMNDRSGGSDISATMISGYQSAVNHVKSICPTAKIIISTINPAYSFFDALSGEGPAAVANYKAEWFNFNQAIKGLGSTPITGVDYRCVRGLKDLESPYYPRSLHPLLAENPGDLHQNPLGSRIIANIWQEGLDAAFGARVPMAPNVPQNLRAVPSSTSISWNWDLSIVDSQHDAATTYQLQTRPVGANVWANQGNPTPVPPATAIGLSPLTAYEGQVKAVNSAGSSAYSSIVQATTTAAGSTAITRMASKGFAVNQPNANYFQGTYPYRNLVRQSIHAWDQCDGVVGNDQWITNLPPGGTATLRIIFGAAFVPPGNYVARTEGGGYVTFFDPSSGGLVQNIVQGNNTTRQATFTIPSFPVGDSRWPQLGIGVIVHNGTGAPINCNDLFVGLQSNFAGHSFSINASGDQIFDPTFLTDLAGCGAMKYADWQLMNSQDHDDTVSPNDLPLESRRSWANIGFRSFIEDPKWNNGVPYGVVAKLMSQLGGAIWPCFPPVHNTYTGSMSAATDTFTVISDYQNGYYHGPCVWATGQRICSVDGSEPAPLGQQIEYFAIVVDQWHFKVASSLNNALNNVPIDITSDATFSMRGIYDPGPVYDAIVDQMYAAAPQVDVMPQIVLEPWNPAFYWNQIRTIMAMFPASLGEISKNDASASLSWRMTRIWQSMDRKFPRSQYIRSLENQGSAFDYSVANIYDYVDTVGRAGVPGANISDLIDASSSAYYPHMKTYAPNGLGPYGDDGNYLDRLRDMIALGLDVGSPAQWSGYFRNGIDSGYYRHRRDRAILDTRTKRHVPMITYEGGLGEATQRGVDGGYIGFTSFDIAGSRIVFDNTGGPGGNQQYEGYPITLGWTSGAGPTGVVKGTQYFCHLPTSTGCQLKTTSTGSTVVAMSGTDTTSSDRFFYPFGDAVKALSTSHYNYTQSAECGADYTYYLTGFYDSEFVNYTHYTWHQGINFFDRGVGQYALKLSQFHPDTPAVAAVRAFHYTPPAAPNPTFIDVFNRTWTTTPSSGTFTWVVKSGSPVISPSGWLGGASFRIESTFTANMMTLAFDIQWATVGGIYPEIRIGVVDDNNHYGVLFANSQPFIFKRVGGTYQSIGQYVALPDNTTITGCTFSLKTNKQGQHDLEFRVNGRIVAYSYGNDKTAFTPGNKFDLALESTIKLANFKVY